MGVKASVTVKPGYNEGGRVSIKGLHILVDICTCKFILFVLFCYFH